MLNNNPGVVDNLGGMTSMSGGNLGSKGGDFFSSILDVASDDEDWKKKVKKYGTTGEKGYAAYKEITKGGKKVKVPVDSPEVGDAGTGGDDEESSNTGLYIGIGVGVLALVGLYLYTKKKK